MDLASWLSAPCDRAGGVASLASSAPNAAPVYQGVTDLVTSHNDLPRDSARWSRSLSWPTTNARVEQRLQLAPGHGLDYGGRPARPRVSEGQDGHLQVLRPLASRSDRVGARLTWRPHTTGRAGPHPAVRSAFPETAVGIEESLQAELGPVAVGQGDGKGLGAGDAPVRLARTRPLSGVRFGDTERSQVAPPCAGAFSFLPSHLP